MATLKIATWNVNSLRVRLPHLLAWIESVKPDIVALQEIKMEDSVFPFAALKEAGYYALCAGQKTYNGVAILSREPITLSIMEIPSFADLQRRVLGVTLCNGWHIINLYVPNGESTISAKYDYKLTWLEHLIRYLKTEVKSTEKVLILGDFNIAPNDLDVHDPALWLDKVLCSTKERQAFKGLLDLGFVDCFRAHHPNEKSYTWWDYRLNAFKRKMGLRIDHILASTPLAKCCQTCEIDQQPRGWERPSDHTPVIAEFTI
jgi:exodeoxyribonuclease III